MVYHLSLLISLIVVSCSFVLPAHKHRPTAPESKEQVITYPSTIEEGICDRCKIYDPHLVRLAYHEAAHLVACLLYGRLVTKAYISKSALHKMLSHRHNCKPLELGRVVHKLGTSKVDRACLLSECAIEAAGYVIEKTFFGSPPRYAEGDMVRVKKWLNKILLRWDSTGKEIAHDPNGTVAPEAIAALQEVVVQNSLSILRKHAMLLNACAYELLSKEILLPAVIAKLAQFCKQAQQQPPVVQAPALVTRMAKRRGKNS